MKKYILLTIIFSSVLHGAVINVVGNCSIVDAITSANTDTSNGGCQAGNGDDELLVSSNQLFSTRNANLNALPLITSKITISSNTGETRVFGLDENASKMRIFEIRRTGDLTLNNIDLIGGDVPSNGGCLFNYGNFKMSNGDVYNCISSLSGGGIYNDGNMELNNVSLIENTTVWGGGGLYNSGTGVIRNSLFINNTAKKGGAIENGLDLSIYKTQITENNTTLETSGAINNRTNLDLNSSSIVNNLTGGIVSATGFTKVYNSTIANNKYGISVSSTYMSIIAEIINSTIAYNTENEIHINGDVDLTIINTIIYDTNNNNCSIETPKLSFSSNLSSDNSCRTIPQNNSINLPQTITGDEINIQYYNLPENSSAVNNGNDSVCSSSAINNKDQIDTLRPQGGSCDVGSIEYIQ